MIFYIGFVVLTSTIEVWAISQEPSDIYGQGLPNQGYLDSFHPTQGRWLLSDERVSRELIQTTMALRLMKTEELLMARKGYLELLHPEDSHAPYRPYPLEIRDIFTNGTHRIFQIEHLLNQLERGTTRLDEQRIQNRRTVFKQLTFLAVTLSQIDRLLFFLSDDLFQDNPSFEQMVQERVKKEPSYTTYWGGTSKSSSSRGKRVRRELEGHFREKLKVSELMENILAQRTVLLNRYPLLGVKIEDGCILYECVYEFLQGRLKLPDLKTSIDSSEMDFNDVHEIELQAIYQGQLETNFKTLSLNEHKLLEWVTPFFDRGIRKSLEGNFRFLQELCKEVYFWDYPTPYLVLALDQSNWKKLLQGDRFFWVDKEVFEQGKRELIALLEKEAEREQTRMQVLEYIGWGTSAVGLATFTVSLGTGALLAHTGRVALGKIITVMGRKVVNRALLASGASYILRRGYAFINQRRYAQLVEDLYTGTVGQNIHHFYQDYQLILKSNYREVIYGVAMIVLCGKGALLKLVRRLFQPVALVGRGAILVSRKGLNFFRAQIQAAKNSLLATLPFFRRLISRTEMLLTPSGQLQRMRMKLTDLAGRNAMKAGTSVRAIREGILSNSLIHKGLEKIMGAYSVFGDSIFIRRQMIVEFLTVISSEILVRGDKIFEQLDYVMLNLMFSMGAIFKLSSQTYHHALKQTGTMTKQANIFPRRGESFSARKFFSNWGKISWGITPSLLWIGGISNGIHLLMESKNRSIDEKDVYRSLENLFYMVSIYSLFSPIRSQFVGQKIDPAIDRLYARGFPGVRNKILKRWTEDIKVPISIANNMVGVVTRSLILGRKDESNHSHYEPDNEDIMYLYREQNNRNIEYLFPEILVGVL